MHETQKTPADEINWDDILPRLMLYSAPLIRSYDLQERISAEDVALETVKQWLTYERDLSHIQNPLAFLMRVAKNIIIDQSRSESALKRRHTETSTSDESLLDIPSITHELQDIELKESLLKAVRDDSKLGEMVETLLEDPSLRSPELAEKLGVRLVDVYRLKKRLRERVFEIAHAH